MIEKNKFHELIESFMDCAALFEKSLALQDILDSPEVYGVDKQQVDDMNDVIGFHKQRYENAGDALIPPLCEIIVRKDAQMDYLGFEVASVNQSDELRDPEMVKILLQDLIKECFCFSIVAAHECTSQNKVSEFLRVLKSQMKL